MVSAARLHREWNEWKRSNAPWWEEVSKCAPQEAFRNLSSAWSRHRRGLGRPPRFHKRGIRDSFRLTGSLRVANGRVRLPRIGEVRTKEATHKFRGRIRSATVRREVDRWFVSLVVERERTDPVPVIGPVVGVDLGLTCFAALSDGTRIQSPKALASDLRRLQHRSRLHARKQRGSRNRAKSVRSLARLHYRIRCRRRDFLHKATTELARTKSVVVVEDLAVGTWSGTDISPGPSAMPGGRSSDGCWNTRPSGTGRGWSSRRGTSRRARPARECGSVKETLSLTS
ncbi:transposase, IS605 OrfB family, partial [mine drainage metagenome]